MSWEQLLAIRDEGREEVLKERSAPLVDCPVCGMLVEWRDGIANCKMGHWRSAGATKGSVKT